MGHGEVTREKSTGRKNLPQSHKNYIKPQKSSKPKERLKPRTQEKKNVLASVRRQLKGAAKAQGVR